MEHERLMVHLPEVMPKLNRKEVEVIQLRFLRSRNQPEKREVSLTATRWQELGEHFGISRERARQIQTKGLLEAAA